MSEDEDSKRGVGYRKPPRASRFRKGQSGNPKRRPRGRRNELPYEAVLGQQAIVREDGRERCVTAAEAFMLHLTKRALDGDSVAARDLMAAFGEIPHSDISAPVPDEIVVRIVSTGCVNTAVERLRIGTKLDRYRETARMVLEP